MVTFEERAINFWNYMEKPGLQNNSSLIQNGRENKEFDAIIILLS